MKKKRGSTALTVLAVTMVLMLLGGILINVIMSRTEGNENKKIRQDLKYGAEGGIEIARGYLAKNGYITKAESEINKSAEILTESKTPESNVTKMEIKLNQIQENDINKIEIISIAEYNENGKNNKEEVKCKIIGGHNGNFMDHGLVGGVGGIEMTDSGSSNLGGTSVSTGQGANIEYPTNGSVFEPDKENEHKNKFGKLKFKSKGRVQKIEAEILLTGKLKFTNSELAIDNVKVKIETVDGRTTTSIVGSSENPEEYIKELDGSIIRIEVVDGAEGAMLSQINPEIYIVNSEEFNMRFNGAIDINNTIIINSGEMEIEGKGSLAMKNSTFIANKIKSGMLIGFQIIGQPNEVNNNSYGVFSEEEEKELSKLLNILIPNWAENNTGGSDYSAVEGESYE